MYIYIYIHNGDPVIYIYIYIYIYIVGGSDLIGQDPNVTEHWAAAIGERGIVFTTLNYTVLHYDITLDYITLLLQHLGEVLLRGVGTLRYSLILSENSACQVPVCAVVALMV